MSPEQLRGETKYGPSADVFSFSVVLWEILTQRMPWDDMRGPNIVERIYDRLANGERLPGQSLLFDTFSLDLV